MLCNIFLPVKMLKFVNNATYICICRIIVVSLQRISEIDIVNPLPGVKQMGQRRGATSEE